ncbi:hypothetical protein [Neisseria meningitidis]|uniref:hypothetical protein n=1 Tax=Neisseria meningitidis TaxID=487 RepID=UPI0009A54F8C|nr:hypothetical protein [Neisseria meningitidis]
MPSERISDGILCLKGQVMSDFLPEFEPCGIYSGLTKIRTIYSGLTKIRTKRYSGLTKIRTRYSGLTKIRTNYSGLTKIRTRRRSRRQ